MYILFDWCQEPGVLKVFGIIKTLLTVIRFAVPIGLIVMTTIDIMKHVFDPNEKEGQKKIVNRIVAAIIIFFVPTIINLVMNIVDVGLGSGEGYKYNISDCWKNAG